MKKYGKYETRPVAAATKQPKAKSALLQTYLTSLLCMLLCVTMFFGTSFAWFTSEVQNTGNEIYIGTLDVGLFKKTDAEHLDLAVAGNKLFNGTIRWEPGYTALETIEVVNQGDLAFKYVLNFTEGKVSANENVTAKDLATVAGSFDVWVFRHYGRTYSEPSSYEDIQNTDGWTNVGTLAELLEGKPLLQGNMNTVRQGNLEEGVTAPTVPGIADSVATVDTYTIALHMNKNADDSVMGHKISLDVKLVAYQKVQEEGAFGGFDRLVATAADLKEALEMGGDVTLISNIVLDEGVTVPKDVTVKLDLNGNNITGKGSAGDSLIVNNGTLTVAGNGKIAITFDGTEDNSKAVNAISNRGVLIVNGGEISNIGKGNQIGYAIDNYNGATLIVNDSKITASGSGYYDGIRLFCGSNDTVVTVNGGEISSIWAQNPSNNKATEVKGTVIINGGTIKTTYFENYTTVKVAEGITATVEAYGAGSDNTATQAVDGYTVYSFVHTEQ